MKNPFPPLDPKAIVAQLRDPRNLNWKTVAALAGVVVALVLLYRAGVASHFREENAPEAITIVGALEAFKRGTGHFPEKLALLKPGHLAEIPQPAPDTNFIYAVSPDGKECWFAYQMHGGILNEYECGTHKWAHREYEDSDALRSLRKEFVMGPKS
jgi:hypothetical protein